MFCLLSENWKSSISCTHITNFFKVADSRIPFREHHWKFETVNQILPIFSKCDHFIFIHLLTPHDSRLSFFFKPNPKMNKMCTDIFWFIFVSPWPCFKQYITLKHKVWIIHLKHLLPKIYLQSLNDKGNNFLWSKITSALQVQWEENEYDVADSLCWCQRIWPPWM